MDSIMQKEQTLGYLQTDQKISFKNIRELKKNANAASLSHFVNGAKPEIGHIIQRKISEQEITPLSEQKQPGITF